MKLLLSAYDIMLLQLLSGVNIDGSNIFLWPNIRQGFKPRNTFHRLTTIVTTLSLSDHANSAFR